MILKQDYTYAIDGESHLINVTEAVKGNNYYCPSCGEIMIPRQGSIRRWHFAHKGNLRNCSYETYLHKVAKNAFANALMSHHNSLSWFIQNVRVQLQDVLLVRFIFALGTVQINLISKNIIPIVKKK